MKLRVPVVAAAALLMADAASAAPQRLACTLTDTDAQSGVEQRSIVLVFDEEAATMRLEEGGRTRGLTDVSISTTSMSGDDADITVGVSRSSLRVVVQTYQKNSVETEYGSCAIDGQKAPSSPAARSPGG
ncbi:MAG: hypothetical protein ACLQJR_26170 [Stellaceae bacterium]